MEKKAKFIKAIHNKYNWYHVDLAYEYKGRTYFVTDTHDGYMESDPLWLQHKREQNRIDNALKAMSEEPEPYDDSAERAFEETLEMFENGDL